MKKDTFDKTKGKRCNFCGENIIFKSKRAFNKYKQYPNKNYYCDRKCYYKSMMKVIEIPKLYCNYCGELLKKNRKVFGKSKFWQSKYHFCSIKCQRKYYSQKRKISKEEKKKNWRKYNQIGWQKQRFRNEILKKKGYCKNCNIKKELQIHHNKPAKLFPELFYDKSNIIVLCQNCHKKLHYPLNNGVLMVNKL